MTTRSIFPLDCWVSRYLGTQTEDASGLAGDSFGPFVAHNRQEKMFQAGALGRCKLIELDAHLILADRPHDGARADDRPDSGRQEQAHLRACSGLEEAVGSDQQAVQAHIDRRKRLLSCSTTPCATRMSFARRAGSMGLYRKKFAPASKPSDRAAGSSSSLKMTMGVF